MFIVTPRLVKPLLVPVTLPTDNHIAPTRGDVLFKGKEEGATPATPATPAKP
jgi:pilus assembly protein CpaC